MTRELNLNDIQGNITRAYGRYSFPFARYYFFHFPDAACGRKFIDKVREKITTAARWPTMQDKPDCTTNCAFTFPGLLALQLSIRALKEMPFEFIEGMKARAFILGDRDQTQTEAEAFKANWNDHWDPIWKHNREFGSDGSNDVHMLVTLNAQIKPGTTDQPHPALEERADWLVKQAEACGVRVMDGVGPDGKGTYQSASAVFDKIGEAVLPTAKEHFGFTDGIGDPVFEGQFEPEDQARNVIGRGKLMGNGWEPLATGEFLLGHPDESQELPPAAKPPEFMHNSSFFAFRKLHENVASFDEVVDTEAEKFAKVMNVDIKEARETIRAKMCGRWSDGVPLMKYPTYDEWMAFRKASAFIPDIQPDDTPEEKQKKALDAYGRHIAYIRSPEARDFRYADDMQGYKCPLGSHMRRVNTRDYLDPLNNVGTDPKTGKPAENPNATSALNKRRRILRRGLPYGPSNLEHKDDDTEQGVIMMIMGANLFRQFEFVQQQWIQYGLDFHQGNNTCPMLGDHSHHKRHTIESDPASGKPPYVMSTLKTFVECRGGDYFFAPSMTGLRMLAMGTIDPT
ncbi:hypothetical protein NHF45_12210 [Maricaulaceae bacterium NA33B04]|nr:hypothetical protein [Maricaulaceae bacterium NA33B04]